MRLTIMQGESGSGKSTEARRIVDTTRNTVRLNRDDIRSMLHLSTGIRPLENLVIHIQTEAAREALKSKFNVVIDDTNLNQKTVERWMRFAQEEGAKHTLHRMDTPFEECLQRDLNRLGTKGFVGRAVIERQFLLSGMLQTRGLPIVLVDVDGTLADHTGILSVYDQSQVIMDRVREDIRDQVRALHSTHEIFIVSGRHSTCGPDTVTWLENKGIPFDHIFMRHGWDDRADTIVKQEILNEILGVVPKKRIVLVIDDRPSVLNMWFDNGLKIQPAREVKEPF